MQGRNLWGIWGGAALIGLGLIFLLGQLLGVNLWGFVWPLIIVAVGLAFFAGMVAGGKSTGALAIPGSVIVTIGLILFIQNLLNIWATWAYAWALIIVGAGVGLLIFGVWSQIPQLRAVSQIVIVAGLAAFFIFGLFFELGAAVLGLGSPGGVIWPVALILLGLYVIFARPFSRWTSRAMYRAEAADDRPMRAATAEPLSDSAGSPWAASSAYADVPPANDRPATTVVTDVELEGVNRLRFRAVGDVTIVVGERAGMAIDASPELKERIISEVRGSELEIRLDENWLDWFNPRNWNFGTVRYTIYLRSLEALEAGGVGNIVVHSLTTPTLDLSLSATGNVTVRQLTAERLSARMSGMGNIEVAGRVERQEVELTGAGNFQADRLESRQASLRLSGLGSASVWVTDDLDAHLSGAGNIDYFGSPRVNQQVSGVGNIHQKGGR
jgi:hypothetical protein